MSDVSAHAISDEWTGLLDADERIVWQGRPSSRLRWEFRSPFEPFFFVFFTGFSVFWMAMASRAGGFFWTFGLLFFVVGSYFLVGQHFWLAYARRSTFYTLTSKRAFIASNVLGRRKMQSYPITQGTVLNYVAGAPGSVLFAREIVRNDDSATTKDIGFEMIHDAREVFALMRKVQERTA